MFQAGGLKEKQIYNAYEIQTYAENVLRLLIHYPLFIRMSKKILLHILRKRHLKDQFVLF